MMSVSGKDASGRLPKFPMDIVKQPGVDTKVTAPFLRLTTTLCRKIRAGDDVLDLVLPGKFIQAGKERSILHQILVRNPGAEKGDLQILHLLPVDHFRVQLKTETIDQLLDIAHGLIRIPAGIDVKQQRPKSHLFLCHISGIGTVEPAGQANDAIKFSSLATFAQ